MLAELLHAFGRGFGRGLRELGQPEFDRMARDGMAAGLLEADTGFTLAEWANRLGFKVPEGD